MVQNFDSRYRICSRNCFVKTNCAVSNESVKKNHQKRNTRLFYFFTFIIIFFVILSKGTKARIHLFALKLNIIVVLNSIKYKVIQNLNKLTPRNIYRKPEAWLPAHEQCILFRHSWEDAR